MGENWRGTDIESVLSIKIVAKQRFSGVMEVNCLWHREAAVLGLHQRSKESDLSITSWGIIKSYDDKGFA